MIELRRIDHVALRVADVEQATRRWALQFGLTPRAPGRLSCDDEPYCLELLPCGESASSLDPLSAGAASSAEPASSLDPFSAGAASSAEPGFDHVAYELARTCSLDQAEAHCRSAGIDCDRTDTGLRLSDPEGNEIHLFAHREPASRWVAHARPAGELPVGHPRKLGHVNFLTAAIDEQVAFYRDVLGMRVTDWLGEGGVWLRIDSEHHVMALVDKGVSHFHHLAFDVVDIGQMRAALDHLGRHGRWLAWGPTRHGVGGNIASYVRIVEEPCLVELYCDMERVEADHEPRVWPDDRFSSNTWGSLPPRSYFRFDAEAIESERESLETAPR